MPNRNTTNMKTYEIILKFYNACGGTAHAQTTFDEADLADPADYIRRKHQKDFDRFRKEQLPNGNLLYTFDNGSVAYCYEFTEI